MILGRTNHQFLFPVKNSIDLFGTTVDNELGFDDHISASCKKINNQFNVMIRFRKRISISTMMRLYRAFILSHFHYCAIVRHFCTSRNSDKSMALNKRILRFILQDRESPYSQLLEEAGTISLFHERIQNMLTILFKCFHVGNYPVYLKRLFTLRADNYSLRGTS